MNVTQKKLADCHKRLEWPGVAHHELGLSTACISWMKVTATRGCGVQSVSQQMNAANEAVKAEKMEKDVEMQAGGEGRE